jgi:serine/threonine-protein kinase
LVAKVAAEVGSTVNNYEVLGKLAAGGMAEIFLAKGASAGGVERYVVLKRILRHRAADAQLVRMFLDEARLAAQLQHSNIAQVYDIGKLGDSFFFTMEYVHGETVRSLLHRANGTRTPVPIGCVLTIAAGALAGLHYAHEKKSMDGRPLGIVHRDVSPSNLMISYDGTVKVVDFGVAKAADRMTETSSGTVKGKISYLAPEQITKGGGVDRRSDLFSFGIVLWEMLTTRRLYRRETDFESMAAIVPSSLRPDVPRELDEMTLRLLSKSPADRYQSAAELQEAIEEIAVRTGCVLSTPPVARFLRELFGQRPEPWIVTEMTEAAEGVTVTMSSSVAEELGLRELDAPEAQLEAVPDWTHRPSIEADAYDSWPPTPPAPAPEPGTLTAVMTPRSVAAAAAATKAPSARPTPPAGIASRPAQPSPPSTSPAAPAPHVQASIGTQPGVVAPAVAPIEAHPTPPPTPAAPSVPQASPFAPTPSTAQTSPLGDSAPSASSAPPFAPQPTPTPSTPQAPQPPPSISQTPPFAPQPTPTPSTPQAPQPPPSISQTPPFAAQPTPTPSATPPPFARSPTGSAPAFPSTPTGSAPAFPSTPTGSAPAFPSTPTGSTPALAPQPIEVEPSRPLAPPGWRPDHDAPQVNLTTPRRPVVIAVTAFAALVVVLVIWRASRSTESAGEAPADAGESQLAARDPANALDARLALPVAADAGTATVARVDAAEVAADAAVAAEPADAARGRTEQGAPPRSDPALEIGRAVRAGNLADAVARCAAVPKLSTELATVCVLSACKTRDVAKARRWARSAKRDVIAACRQEGVELEPRPTTTSPRPTRLDAGVDCGADLLGCQH